MIRSPICSVLGHVDHGKSSILDKIRGTAIIKREAGGITQAIGASIIPIEVIKDICGNLLDSLKKEISIPGVLFIDTPGHAAFTSLRKRGGNLADIAIVVVDINEGFKPQTIETIEILKQYKTPFFIAANKIDLIYGFKSSKEPILVNISRQEQSIQTKIDERLYEIVGSLYELGIGGERFDRVEDYTKQIAIVPVSAQTGDGIPELLMVLTGLTQKYLEEGLSFNIDGPAKGTILEIKQDKGLGTTADIIIYDGSLKQGDTIVIGGLEKPIVTKIKALLEPDPLAEMRDKKSKFKSVKKVSAATGVKVSAPELENVVAGMPVRASCESDLDIIKEEIQKEVDEVIVEIDKKGIIIKADSLGSLEALIKLLKEKEINVRKASVGPIIKKDIIDAESNMESNPLETVVLGFNVNLSTGVEAGKVKIITNEVIYKIIEDLEKWKEEEKKKKEMENLKDIVRPCKIKIMQGYVFRQNNPAVVGVEVLSGILRNGIQVMKKENDNVLITVKSVQDKGENLAEAEKGKQVAVSLANVTVGRQIFEGDILYSYIPEKDFKELKKVKKYLKEEEIEILKEIAEMKRKENPVWGI